MAKGMQRLLKDAMSEKHFSFDRLQELTGIPVHFLKMMLEGGWETLPPKPYVRGYLLKLAEVLDINEERLLGSYSRDELDSSGSKDGLPVNRFRMPKIRYRHIFIALAVVILLFYLVFFSAKSRTPYLHLFGLPEQDQPVVINQPDIFLEGRVEPGDSLFVNDEEIAVNNHGEFSFEYPLSQGLNTLVFKVERFLGGETEMIRQVVFEKINLEKLDLESGEPLIDEELETDEESLEEEL